MFRNVSIAIAVLSSFVFGSIRLACADEKEVDAKQVRRAIERGITFLKSKQDPVQGTWPDHGGQTGGVTALCILALLNSGVPVGDEAIQHSLTYLRKLPPNLTYVTSLQTMVFCLADPKSDRQLIERNVKWIEANQIKEGSRSGSWSYPGKAIGGDNSNSHFALMALYEAQQASMNTNARVWQRASDYFKSAQNDDGSFGYYKTPLQHIPASGSMTCAGISSLAMASIMRPSSDATMVGETINCCGDQATDDSPERIQRALSWLATNFSVERNPHDRPTAPWHYYYLWGLEHSCRLAGQHAVGKHDWYREGAAFLCREDVQLDGTWRGEGTIEADREIATSFALLFISEGRRPIAVAKLRYGRGGDWNHHRHDAANLVHYIESKWRKEFPTGLSWQTIEFGKASAENLLESPVLFVSGREAPQISDEQAKVLHEYLDRGGCLFAEASCSGGEKFDRGFRELASKIAQDAELKSLAADHRLWSAEEAVPAEKRPPLLGIDFKGRTRIIYSPPPKDGGAGLSCCWELAALADAKTTPPAVAARIAAAKSIGLNIVAYATERKLRTRDEFLTTK
jgi:hypothetical protein